MKRLVCLTVLFIMLICCAAAGGEEKMAFVFEDSIPREYLKQAENGGKAVKGPVGGPQMRSGPRGRGFESRHSDQFGCS